MIVDMRGNTGDTSASDFALRLRPSQLRLLCGVERFVCRTHWAIIVRLTEGVMVGWVIRRNRIERGNIASPVRVDRRTASRRPSITHPPCFPADSGSGV